MAHKRPVTVYGHPVGTWLWNCQTGVNVVSIPVPEALFFLDIDATIDFPGLFASLSWLADVFGGTNDAKATVDKQLAAWKKSHKSGASVEFSFRFTVQVDKDKLTTKCPHGPGYASLGYELQLKVELVTGAAVKTTGFDAGAGVAGSITVVLASELVECRCGREGSTDLPEETPETLPGPSNPTTPPDKETPKSEPEVPAPKKGGKSAYEPPESGVFVLVALRPETAAG